MQLSSAGGVVLVDDNFDEAAPLIRALGHQGFSHLYFSGSMGELPEEPLTGIRFMFLDIQLAGMHGQSNENIASALLSVVTRIVSATNGPYVVVFWTAHENVIEKVMENLDASGIAPVQYIVADKLDFIGDTFDLGALLDHIQEKLNAIGAFALYVQWENLLNVAAKEFITNFSSHAPKGSAWSQETARLFYRLYKARVGKNELDDELQQFRCACHVMNRCFLDSLQSKTDQHLELPEGLSLSDDGPTLSNEVNAKLNTSLFLSHHHAARPHTGSVYITHGRRIRDMLALLLFKNDQRPMSIKECQIVITPECDLAQSKNLVKADGSRVHQVVYGVFYAMEKISIKEERKRLHDKGKDSRYMILPLWHDDAIYVLVTHFASLSLAAETELPNTPDFTLSRDIMFDIQSKAANHMNRLGNYLLQ